MLLVVTASQHVYMEYCKRNDLRVADTIFVNRQEKVYGIARDIKVVFTNRYWELPVELIEYVKERFHNNRIDEF